MIHLVACTVSQANDPSGKNTDDSLTPNETIAPTAIVAEPLRIGGQGFVQDGTELKFGFWVENQNDGYVIEQSEYRVIACADDGTVLGTESGWIARVPAAASWGIAGTVRLTVAEAVAQLDVRVVSGNAKPDFPVPAFAVERVAYFADMDAPRATGVIHNPYRLAVSNVLVDVLLFDEDGVVLSGARTYVDYIPGEGEMGIEVFLSPVRGVARVVLYPGVTSAMRQIDPETWPREAMAPILVEQGFAQEGTQVVWVGRVQNPCEDHAIKDLLVALTVYDAKGMVLAARDAGTMWLLPTQDLAIVHALYLPEGRQAARVTAELLPRAFVAERDVRNVPTFAAEDVTLGADERYPKAYGRIVNLSDHDVTDVRVHAVLYDQAGTIVGGGYAYVDFVPARGKAAASVQVIGPAEKVTNVALSVCITSISKLD